MLHQRIRRRMLCALSARLAQGVGAWAAARLVAVSWGGAGGARRKDGGPWAAIKKLITSWQFINKFN